MVLAGKQSLSKQDGQEPVVKKAKRRGPKKKPPREYGKGRWTDEERILFLVGLRKYGKGKWKEIAKVLTTRSAVQIKSHGQKIYGKLQPGEDIFFELNEYERRTSTRLQPATDGTCVLPGKSGDRLAQEAPSLVQAPSMEDSDGILSTSDSKSDLENRPPQAILCPAFLPSPDIPSYLPSNKDGPPLLRTQFGIPNGISFVNDSPPAPTVIPAPKPIKPTTTASSATSPVQNQGDVYAAMVLCKLGSAGSNNSTTQTAALVAPIATRPSFLPEQSATKPSIGTGPGGAFNVFEPISLKSMEKAEDDELLADCCPVFLHEDDDDSSNVVTPTNFAEV